MILFLRNQIDYALSLYLELVAHGLDIAFDSFLEEIATKGSFRWREWRFPFEFHELLYNLENVDGMRLKVSSYDAYESEMFLDRFLEMCELPSAGSAFALRRENVRRSGGWYFKEFLSSTGFSAPESAWRALLDCVDETLSERSLAVSEKDRLLIADVFRDSNECVSARYGVRLNEFMSSVTESDISRCVSISSLFSSDLRNLLQSLSVKPQSNNEKGPVEALAVHQQAPEGKKREN